MAEDTTVKREPQYVGFWKRVFASIIDTLILVVVIGLIVVAVYGMQYVRLSSEGKTLMFDLLVQGLLPALAVIVFWRYRGATPGKMLISAKIVDAETFGTPSTGKLIGRYFGRFGFAGVDDGHEQVLKLRKLGLECCRPLPPWQVCREKFCRSRA